MCRAGSASAFITIPGSRISTPGLSISFWYSIPSPSSILWWKQSHSSAIEHQSPVSYQVSVVGKKVSRKGSTKSPRQELRQIWWCGSKAWRDEHCTELCSWRSTFTPSAWTGFACGNYSLALYFAYSHMILLKKHRAAPLWV